MIIIVIIIINNVYYYGGAITNKLYTAGPPYSVKSRDDKLAYTTRQQIRLQLNILNNGMTDIQTL